MPGRDGELTCEKRRTRQGWRRQDHRVSHQWIGWRRWRLRPGDEPRQGDPPRRSCARIYYDAKAPLKQIQFLLGHDKLDTTARYVNDEQKFGGEAVSKVADIS